MLHQGERRRLEYHDHDHNHDHSRFGHKRSTPSSFSSSSLSLSSPPLLPSSSPPGPYGSSAAAAVAHGVVEVDAQYVWRGVSFPLRELWRARGRGIQGSEGEGFKFAGAYQPCRSLSSLVKKTFGYNLTHFPASDVKSRPIVLSSALGGPFVQVTAAEAVEEATGLRLDNDGVYFVATAPIFRQCFLSDDDGGARRGGGEVRSRYSTVGGATAVAAAAKAAAAAAAAMAGGLMRARSRGGTEAARDGR